MTKIVLGCGHKRKEGWVNIDKDAQWRPDILRDVTRGLPFNNSCIEEVHSENMLEHLDPTDFVFVMQEIHRVLTIGGMAELIVPLGVVPDATHRTYFHTHTFNNLFQQKETYNLDGMNILFSELKKHDSPHDYTEMRITIQKTY